MGNYSWCTSDTRKSIPCFGEKYEGAPSVIYLLNPFGEPYKAEVYGGYGLFAGEDVFKLVAEWNKEFLSTDNIVKPDRKDFARSKEGGERYRVAFNKYEAECLRLSEFVAGKPDSYMRNKYGPQWKRFIGINIVSSPQNYVKLRYPIKIVEKPCSYEKADISPECPFRGGGYEEVFGAQLQQGVDRAFEALLEAKGKYADEKADALDTFFSFSKMDDCYIDQTYPHLIVKDGEGHRWKDAQVYDFVLNECLAFEKDGTLQFGFGAISQSLADTLVSHAKSCGVKITSFANSSVDKQIANAESLKKEYDAVGDERVMDREI